MQIDTEDRTTSNDHIGLQAGSQEHDVDGLKLPTGRFVVESEAGEETPEARKDTELEAQERAADDKLDWRPACLLSLFAAALFVWGMGLFPNDSILLLAGGYLILGLYPYIRTKRRIGARRLAQELVLLVVVIAVSFFFLKSVFPDSSSHTEVVIFIAALLGVKLVFFPVYG